MSYKSFQMWTVVCDEPGCGEEYEDEHEGIVTWMDRELVDEVALSSDWWREGGKHFCPDHTPVAAAYEGGAE